MPLNKSYSNYVSLGSFCSVAMELERFGLRSASFPFDWLLSDFRGVVEAINSNFGAFFDESFFEQSKQRLYVYRNSKYGFEFVHNFSKYKPLSTQLDVFREKYNRRINRFFKVICDSATYYWILFNHMGVEISSNFSCGGISLNVF